MKKYIKLKSRDELSKCGFRYSRRSCSFVHDEWGAIRQWDIDIAQQNNYKALLLEYDPGKDRVAPFIVVRIKDRVVKLPAIAAYDFQVSGKKQFFSGFYEKPIGRGKSFKVTPTKGITVGYSDFNKNEAEKMLWYLIEYLGAEKIFHKLAKKLGYEIDE